MDGTDFDRLVKFLSDSTTRRDTGTRLVAAVVAAVGLQSLQSDETQAGLRNRRRLRNKRDHDNRKGKRKGPRNQGDRPPGSGAPVVDCSKSGMQGKICNDTSGGLPPRRCCNGSCFPYQNCVEAGKNTGLLCEPNDDCRGADRLCCSGWGACDTPVQECVCALAQIGEGCSSDWDCSEGVCICGVCR